VQTDELKQLLTTFTAERLALLQRHEAGARVVSHYDFNNTYQYVINREEMQLGWLENALADLGLPLPAAASTLPVPDVQKQTVKRGKEVAPSIFRPVLDDDAQGLGDFVARWRDRVQAMTHARHRTMLNVILGESLEHQRLFEQAAAGLEDLLGRRTGDVPRVGEVLPVRWLE
jgi:uncharacterized protein (DUF1501 family)